MAENAVSGNNLAIIRDPSLVKNRIFIGNLPVCTREQLESICFPYGNVIGSMVQKNFGFVQFESEEIANKTAAALNKSTFKGNLITVRNAGAKVAGKQQGNAGPVGPAPMASAANLSNLILGGSKNTNPDYNDCEIIVVDRRNTNYAEMIEARLKQLKLRVDVLFPNEDVPLGKVLGNISSRGCLYAVLVTNQHQENESITVNILYGSPQEHRNIGVEQGIQLIADDFHAKLQREGAFMGDNVGGMGNMPGALPMSGAAKNTHPEAMQVLINLLSNNHHLTALQYESVIKYLQGKHEAQLRIELGDTALIENKAPDPEFELQKKIMNILQKPSVTETTYHRLYPNIETLRADRGAMELLSDVRVQRALDSLVGTDFMWSIAKKMNF